MPRTTKTNPRTKSSPNGEALRKDVQDLKVENAAIKAEKVSWWRGGIVVGVVATTMLSTIIGVALYLNDRVNWSHNSLMTEIAEVRINQARSDERQIRIEENQDRIEENQVRIEGNQDRIENKLDTLLMQNEILLGGRNATPNNTPVDAPANTPYTAPNTPNTPATPASELPEFNTPNTPNFTPTINPYFKENHNVPL